LREVIHCELGGDDRPDALVVSIDARHVIQNADLERSGSLRASDARRQRQGRASDQDLSSIWPLLRAHSVLLAVRFHVGLLPPVFDQVWPVAPLEASQR